MPNVRVISNIDWDPSCIILVFPHLCERLLVLPVLEGVDEGVEDGGGPGEDGGEDVQEGVADVVVGHVHYHQGQEADLGGNQRKTRF